MANVSWIVTNMDVGKPFSMPVANRQRLEAGWLLHHVQRMLGHVDVKQTATYLNAAGGLAAAG